MATFVSRKPASAVHCVVTSGGTVQTVSSRGVVLLDLQARDVGTDGRARYSHASVGMHLADARELLEQLASAIAEASAGRVAPTPAAGWQDRLAAPETARWGMRPNRAVLP